MYANAVLFMILAGCAAAWAAQRKGRNPWLWFALGGLTAGIAGILLAKTKKRRILC